MISTWLRAIFRFSYFFYYKQLHSTPNGVYIEWPVSHDYTFAYSTDTNALISSASNSGTSIAAKWPPYIIIIIITLVRSSSKMRRVTYAIVCLGKHQIGTRFLLYPPHRRRDELLREHRVSEWLHPRWAQQFSALEFLLGLAFILRLAEGKEEGYYAVRVDGPRERLGEPPKCHKLQNLLDRRINIRPLQKLLADPVRGLCQALDYAGGTKRSLPCQQREGVTREDMADRARPRPVHFGIC